MPKISDDTDARISKTPQAIQIFYSYSHKDEDLRDELERHLSVLKRQGVIAGWHDRRISAGSEWKDAIDDHLATAGIILLLISSDFLASDYCYEKEMTRAMARHAEGSAHVIPIILRDCDWSDTPFSKLQALPKDARPITSWQNIDEAFTNVAIGLKKAIGELSPAPPREQGWYREVKTDPPLGQMNTATGSQIRAEPGDVAYGDHALGNITITGGAQGDFIKGDKRQTQGNRSIIDDNSSGHIKTGDEMHHHHYVQSPSPTQQFQPAIWFVVALLVAISIVVFVYLNFSGGTDIYRLRVMVVDPQGIPVEDAKVWSFFGGEPKRVAGGWQFDIPEVSRPKEGKLTVQASKESAFLTGRAELTLGNDRNPTVIINLKYDDSAKIRGQIIDARGNAVVGARVWVIGYGSEAVTTQSTGDFELPAHAALNEQVQLHVEKPGHKVINPWLPAGTDKAVLTLGKGG